MAHDLSTDHALTPLQQRGREVIARMRAGNPDQVRPLTSTSSMPRIGIALGGGSARGLTHIPFIEAMDELGLKPSVIAGTSIGALIGAGWANGMTGLELREHAIEVLGTMRTIAGRIWGTHASGLGGLFRNGLSVQLDGSKVVDAFLPHPFPATFEELQIPLYVVATDFRSWHQAVFNAGELRQPAAARPGVGLRHPCRD
jgi:NTE family protein